MLLKRCANCEEDSHDAAQDSATSVREVLGRVGICCNFSEGQIAGRWGCDLLRFDGAPVRLDFGSSPK